MKFNPGAVVRVKMKNFLTFDEAEVFPGPRLNVVIGPNGTGKSSLTHAICLACAGESKDTGRARSMHSYVKNDTPEGEISYVEVELQGSKKSLLDSHISSPSKHESTVVNKVIRRVFNRENRNEYYVNGKKTTKEEVKNIVREFKIYVDNLCTFMPQDRVGEFSQYNQKELLDNVLKTQSYKHDQSLYDLKVELVEAEKGNLDNKLVLAEKIKKLENNRLEFKAIEPQIKSIFKKKQLQKYIYTIELLLKKDDITQSNLLVNEKLLAIEEVKKYGKSLKKFFDQKIDPYYSKLKLESDQLDQLRKKYDEKLKDFENKISELTRSIKKFQIENDRIAQDILNYNTTTKNLQKKIEDEEAMYQEKLHHFQNVSSSLEVGNIKEIEDKIHKLTKNELADLKRKQYHHKSRATELEREKNLKLKELQNLPSEAKLFFNILQNLSTRGNGQSYDHAKQAFAWFLSEKDKLVSERKIIGNVYGPVAFYLTNSNKVITTIIEKAIPLNRLLSFIVENDHDATFLKRLFRQEMRLQIDIYTMNNVTHSHGPYRQNTLHELQRYGIKGHLIDQINVNPTIRAFLCDICRLHLILWGESTEELPINVLSSLCSIMNTFTVYLHNPNGKSSTHAYNGEIIEYRGSLSRYAPNNPPSTVTSIVYPKNIINSSSIDSRGTKAALENEIEAIDNEISQVSDIITQINKEYIIYNTKLDEYQKLRDNIVGIHRENRKKKDELDSLESKIHQHKQFLKERDEKNFIKLKETFVNNLKDILDGQNENLKIIQNISMYNGLLIVINKEKTEIEKRLNTFNSIKNIFDEKIKKTVTDENELKLEIKILNDRKRDAEESFNELMEEFINFTEEDPNQVFYYLSSFLPDATVDELKYKKIEYETEFKNLDSNEHMLKRYETLQNSIKQLEEDINKLKDDEIKKMSSFEKKSADFNTRIDSIKKLLHDKFEKYMSKLNLKGAIDICTPTNKYCDYQLFIKVAFRQGTDLANLDGNLHSGGERAVSTIMFLMSLLELSVSPFKIVDEINQGMDARNERLVLDRIVKNCCQDYPKEEDNRQFFLVTPKLLLGLRSFEHENVTVLLVLNGQGLPDKQWNLDKVIRSIVDDDNYEDEDEDLEVGNKRRLNIDSEEISKIQKLGDCF